MEEQEWDMPEQERGDCAGISLSYRVALHSPGSVYAARCEHNFFIFFFLVFIIVFSAAHFFPRLLCLPDPLVRCTDPDPSIIKQK